jgi:hypothetical protein
MRRPLFLGNARRPTDSLLRAAESKKKVGTLLGEGVVGLLEAFQRDMPTTSTFDAGHIGAGWQRAVLHSKRVISDAKRGNFC